ncbi:MAG: hypothetical protein LBK58_13410, partial [Prevotellaceae bacterium]|nr:hypothetical protein [Prevotellaceae bacterium]
FDPRWRRRGICRICPERAAKFFLDRPFNEQKYKGLLEGLRIIEVSIIECLSQNDCRLESDFWTQNNNPQIKTIKGSEIIDFVQYGTSKELNEGGMGFPVLRLNEFYSRFIGVPSKYCNIISTEEYEKLRLKKGDVLICRTNGNPNLVGKSALVAEDTEYAYASYLFKIRPKTEIISSHLYWLLFCPQNMDEKKLTNIQ